jgi:hypothetical protein
MHMTLHEVVDRHPSSDSTRVTGIASTLLQDEQGRKALRRCTLNGENQNSGLMLLVFHSFITFERFPLVMGSQLDISGTFVRTDFCATIHSTHHPAHGECDGGIEECRETEKPTVFL